MPETLGQLVHQVDGGVGDNRAGREDRRGSGGVQLVEVAGRDDPADDDHDVGPAHLGQRVPQCGHQRQVARRKRGHPDHMHVVVGGLSCHLVRGGEQRADVDVESDVRERRCDHLLPAIVAILAHLGHQDPRPPTVGLGELLDEIGGVSQILGLSSFVAVNPRNSTDLRPVPPVHLLQRIGDLTDGRFGPCRVDRQRQQVVAQPVVPGPALRPGRAGQFS